MPLGELMVAAVVGVMLFFSVAVAPTIFKVLPETWAAVYVRAFFPKYYLSLGLMLLAAGWLLTDRLSAWLTLGCAAAFFVSRSFLAPAINRARDADQTLHFQVLHITSIAINMLQLLTLLGVLALFLDRH